MINFKYPLRLVGMDTTDPVVEDSAGRVVARTYYNPNVESIEVLKERIRWIYDRLVVKDPIAKEEILKGAKSNGEKKA